MKDRDGGKMHCWQSIDEIITMTTHTKIKVGDWVNWSGYVCSVLNIDDFIILKPLSENFPFKLSSYREKEMTVLTEEEAVMSILKGNHR